MKRIICVAIISMLPAATASAQQPTRAAGQRPDLSGIWSTFPGVNPVSGLKREVGGVATHVSSTARQSEASSATAAVCCRGPLRHRISLSSRRRSRRSMINRARLTLCFTAHGRDCREWAASSHYPDAERDDLPLRRHVWRSLSHYSDRRSRAPRKRKSVVLRRRSGEMGRGDARHRRPELRRGYGLGEKGYFHTDAMRLLNGYGVMGRISCGRLPWTIPTSSRLHGRWRRA